MKAKTTRRALFMSALSLLLCVSMLVGTTFAWFTDSVTSAGNVIQSGTLDVDLVDALGSHLDDLPRHSLSLDNLSKGVASAFGHLLRVVEQRVVEVGW